MDSTMTTILVTLLGTILVVSLLIGRLAKLTLKEMVTQTVVMTTAGLVFFGLVSLL